MFRWQNANLIKTDMIVPCDSMAIFIGSNIIQTFQQIDTDHILPAPL